jgi:ribonuclease HI
MAIRLPYRFNTNNAGEAVAILVAIQRAPPNHILQVFADSQYALKGLTSHLAKAEDGGWIGVANADLLKACVSTLRTRQTPSLLVKVKAHSGIRGNEEADRLANEGAKKELPSLLNLDTNPLTLYQGLRLSRATQASLYRSLLLRKRRPLRATTNNNIEIVQEELLETFQTSPTEDRIWMSLKSRDINRNIREFLWKTMHGIYKLGTIWLHIPNCEARAICPLCLVTETMDHILTTCKGNGQDTVWRLTRTLWECSGHKWPSPSLGLILGSPLAEFKKPTGKLDSGSNRLYRILITESAHLIWRMRCEWRINGSATSPHGISRNEVSQRWRRAISLRILQDTLSANTWKYGRKATPKEKVNSTWKGILGAGNFWLWSLEEITEFLVGIDLGQPPGLEPHTFAPVDTGQN